MEQIKRRFGFLLDLDSPESTSNNLRFLELYSSSFYRNGYMDEFADRGTIMTNYYEEMKVSLIRRYK